MEIISAFYFYYFQMLSDIKEGLLQVSHVGKKSKTNVYMSNIHSNSDHQRDGVPESVNRAVRLFLRYVITLHSINYQPAPTRRVTKPRVYAHYECNVLLLAANINFRWGCIPVNGTLRHRGALSVLSYISVCPLKIALLCTYNVGLRTCMESIANGLLNDSVLEDTI